MGFKSIELQVAIPRSQDAGRMQDQMMRQGQQFQETLTQQKLREEVINRTKVNEYDDVRKKNITDEDEKNKREKEMKKNKKNDKGEESETTNHPYLGKKIDFSG